MKQKPKKKWNQMKKNDPNIFFLKRRKIRKKNQKQTKKKKKMKTLKEKSRKKKKNSERKWNEKQKAYGTFLPSLQSTEQINKSKKNTEKNRIKIKNQAKMVTLSLHFSPPIRTRTFPTIVACSNGIYISYYLPNSHRFIHSTYILFST